MLSCLADFSAILDLTSKSSESGEAAVMQVTSTLKLAARAGRFFRLVKLLKLLPGMKQLMDTQGAGTARKISDKLQMALSIRVSFLIIFMVVLIPVLLVVTMHLAEQDLGIISWPIFLAKSVELAEMSGSEGTLSTSVSSNRYTTLIGECSQFFEDQDFFPYQVHRRFAYGPPGVKKVDQLPWNNDDAVTSTIIGYTDLAALGRLGESAPNRKWNSVKRERLHAFSQAEVDANPNFASVKSRWTSNGGTIGASDQLYSVVGVRYNFTKPHQLDSQMNMLLILVVMSLLITFAMQLRTVVGQIVLEPLEELLHKVRTLAATMFQSVVDMSSAMRRAQEKDGDEDAAAVSALRRKMEMKTQRR